MGPQEENTNLRTSAAVLIAMVLIAGPVAAQPSGGGTNSTAAPTNQDIRSSTKPMSVQKQTNRRATEKNAGKRVVHRRLRHPVVYHGVSGRQHLVSPRHTALAQVSRTLDRSAHPVQPRPRELQDQCAKVMLGLRASCSISGSGKG
jgi:hypothetical protein